MSVPELWIIAGPNGAGKTTTVQDGGLAASLAAATFINPDAITLEYLKQQGFDGWDSAPATVLQSTFIQAAEDAERMLAELIEAGGCVAVESVLSTRKYCALVERVLELGGDFHLVYVALSSPALSAERVSNRRDHGGHDVPVEKLAPRWRASLDLLPWFALRATSFYLLDNSDSRQDQPARLLISGFSGVVCLHGVPTPAMRPVVADFINAFSSLNTSGRWRLDIAEAYHTPD